MTSVCHKIQVVFVGRGIARNDERCDFDFVFLFPHEKGTAGDRDLLNRSDRYLL